ncbi:MAG TPA: transglycosylase SLT domain-containing protein [Xanthobacteraceae bacterium]
MGIGSAVVGAIRDAASATGAAFQYLLATAQVESGLNPTASASSSSAKGLFQFVDQTWLTTLKESGPALGYGRYADAIVKTSSGRYEVPDPAMRREIMALRDDPTANAAMAGAFTQQNGALVADRIGRPPTEGELYLAHFLGASGAAQLINLAARDPTANAATAFPSAARANHSIFYDHAGQARSAVGVYNLLVARYDVARATPAGPAASAVAANAAAGAPGLLASVVPAALPSQGAPSATTAATAPVGPSNVIATTALDQSRPAFNSLFRNDERRGPVSQFVRDLWTTRPEVAAALTGQAVSATTSSPPQPAATPGAPLDLFSDQQSNAKALFGVGS